MNENETQKSIIDFEAELARILDEEIWKEITATTGETKADLDNRIIEQLLSLIKTEDKTFRNAEKSRGILSRAKKELIARNNENKNE